MGGMRWAQSIDSRADSLGTASANLWYFHARPAPKLALGRPRERYRCIVVGGVALASVAAVVFLNRQFADNEANDRARNPPCAPPPRVDVGLGPGSHVLTDA